MRINIEHPVIVTGRWPDGTVRHDLVRTGGEFEIAEYGNRDAPVTFVLGDKREHRYRTIEGKHYCAAIDFEQHQDIAETAMNLLFLHSEFGVDPIPAFMAVEADRIKREFDLTASVQNRNQRFLMREHNIGHTQDSVDCMKAPKLRNWTWLSGETTREVERWHAEAASVFSNLVLIDGIPYRRMAEPRFGLSFISGPLIETSPLYTRQVHRPDFDLDGLHIMHKDALMVGIQNFGLGDMDEMYAFAREVGWACDRRFHGLEIRDGDALSVDHLKMETIRHAMIVLHRVQKAYLLNLPARAVIDEVEESAATRALGETIVPLRNAIREWQREEGDTSDVALALENSLAAIQNLPDAPKSAAASGGFTLIDQMYAFRLRQDSAPISVSAMQFGC